MKEVQDRVVQFSNRYKLTNAETGEVLGTFDFDEVTGTVQQVGTEIDAELFDGIAADLAARVVANGGDIKDTVVTFSDTTGTAANVASGDKTSTLWGKVKNWFSRLKALAFKDKISDSDIDDGTISKSKIDGLTEDLNSKYVKPSGGIPASDLDEGSQNNLGNVNKSIYNLGAYDTYIPNGDGTATITRKTGYLYISPDLNWILSPRPGYNGQYLFLADVDVLWSNIKCNTLAVKNPWTGGVTYSIWNKNNRYRVSLCLTGTEDDTVEGLKLWLSENPTYIQYELATSYTETVIDNQPLATLDQNGEQWLRSEWEKIVNYGHIVHEKDLETATVNNSNNLGGVAASQYALKTDIPESLDGTTFTPNVDSEGNLSWTNNGGLPNPDPVNIKGQDGAGIYTAQVKQENPLQFIVYRGSGQPEPKIGDAFIVDDLSVEYGGHVYTIASIVSSEGSSYYTVTGNYANIDLTGDTGATPTISATASVSNTIGPPSVSVTKSGTDENPSFAFAFSGLKGEPGEVALYRHIIKFSFKPNTYKGNVFAVIYNNTETRFNLTSLTNFINNLESPYPISGYFYDAILPNQPDWLAIYLMKNEDNTNTFRFYYFSASISKALFFTSTDEIRSISDNVSRIL